MIATLEWVAWGFILASVLIYTRPTMTGPALGVVGGVLIITWAALVDAWATISVNVILTALHGRNVWLRR